MYIDMLEKVLGIRFGLLLFDANGPLFPNVPDKCPREAFDGLLGGNIFPKDEPVDFTGNWIEAMAKHGVNKKDFALLAEISNLRFEHDKPFLKMFDWVPCVLYRLSKTRKLAIVTDTSRAMIEHALPKNVLSDFGSIVTCERLQSLGLQLKDAPDGLLLACKDCGVDPKWALYIGDSDKDVRTSKNANMNYVVVPEGAHHALFRS